MIKDKMIEQGKVIISPITFFLCQNSNNGEIILSDSHF